MSRSITNPRIFLTGGAGLALLATVLLCFSVSNVLAAIDLKPLIDAAGTEVVLDGNSTYAATQIQLLTDKTILCNGATIQSSEGPIRTLTPGVVLTIDNCVIEGTGWALLDAQNNSYLVIRNSTQLIGNGSNSCIFIDESELSLTDTSIENCKWGAHLENANATFDGVTIENTMFGVQNVAGHVIIDGNSHLQNLNTSNPGVGVSIIASTTYPDTSASAVIRNSSFTGFGNAVDIQPTAAAGLPAGTVEITNSTFNLQAWSALAAVDAVDLLFASNRVVDVLMDGIFLVNSTGVIEDSEIIDSLNTGVTFWGCPDGATLRNSLIKGSVHQGVAVVGDYDNDRDSRNIQIIGNTLQDNVIANILVDERSDAVIQGNILNGSPGVSARLHGSRSATLIGNFFHEAAAGLETKNAANANLSLSVFAHHNDYGALLYSDSVTSVSHSAFQDNGVLTGNYSVFINDGAQFSLQQSVISSAGMPGLYNNAGNTALIEYNYWDHASGPELPYNNGGSGSLIGWNVDNNSSVSYQPYLTSTPLDMRINEGFTLSAHAFSSWLPDIGVSLHLTGVADATTITDGFTAALRLRETSALELPFPPSKTFTDGVIAVWAEYDLLSEAQSGSLRFQTGGDGELAQLSRLEANRCWTPMDTAWDSDNGEVVFSPSDPNLLAGIFALGPALPEQETAARDLITAYYWDVLNRAPEAGAEDSWFNGYFSYSIQLDIDVRFVFREMARVFFSSYEYQNRNRTNEQFILDNYQVFLRRSPSPSELDSWRGGDWDRSQVVSLFAESEEFSKYIRGLFTCTEGISTRNFITTMYIGLLDRLVDGAGLGYFENVFVTAFTAQGIAGVRSAARNFALDVIASTEYQSTNPANSTHVERLYRAFLGRFPSAHELIYWQGQLDSQNMTLSSIIDMFSNSPEFTSKLHSFFGSI